MTKFFSMKSLAGGLMLVVLPALALAALRTPGRVVIDQNGNRLTASINLHSNPDSPPNDIVWTAQLTNSVIFFGQNGSQVFMCTVDRSAATLFSIATQVRTGFSNGGYLVVTKNAQGQCTSVMGANSSEFFE